MMTVFTYGSLMCADIMSAVTGQQLEGEHATLADYRRYAVAGEHYPGAVAEAAQQIDGVIYTGVSDAALARLDAFEGEYYVRTSVIVRLARGATVDAQTYLWRDGFRHKLAPWDWSFNHFLARGKDAFTARYMGFSRV